jgi:hypothetical protein
VIEVRLASPEEAILHYSVEFPNGYKGRDSEQYKKIAGLWYLRMKKIEENAAQTKAALDKYDTK